MELRPIRLRGVRQNNLRAIDLDIPLGGVTVVTGVAGAGKSSLAMEVLYSEGYRQYVETFSPYARQFLAQLERPQADEIDGVLPAIAVGRAGQVRTSRSTVGTITSVDDYLRPLFARAATLYCRSCGRRVEEQTPEGIAGELLREYPEQRLLLAFERPLGGADPELVRGGLAEAGFTRVLQQGRPLRLEEADFSAMGESVRVVVDRLRVRREDRERLLESIETALHAGRGHLLAIPGDGTGHDEAASGDRELRFSTELHCPYCDIHYPHPDAGDFSFNNPVGACPSCRGFGRIIDIDPDLVVPDKTLSIAEGAVRPFQSSSFEQGHEDMLDYARAVGIPTDKPWIVLGEENTRRLWDGDEDRGWYGIHAFFRYLEGKRYRKHARILLSRYRRYLTCPDCKGTRLKPYAGLFRFRDRWSFPDMQGMMVSELRGIFDQIQDDADARPIQLLVRNIRDRLRFLDEVGLGYLSLGRQARTLSGGETQRVTLATAIGAALSDTLYVLDEPSVGLHARDKDRLAAVLGELSHHKNAIVVVENDWPFIRRADHIVDLGPGAGSRGGSLLYSGPLAGFLESKDSPTVRYLREPVPKPRGPAESRVTRAGELRKLTVRGAVEHNLRNLDVDIPLNAVVCVTGVSGSGKSTLVDDVLYRNVLREQGQAVTEPGRLDGLAGTEAISRAVLVEQTPLSRSSRMTAATYLKVLDPLRRAFAGTEGARRRGLSASAFSYNSGAGACPNCGGSGYEQIELQFLPDAYVHCPVCNGRRFRGEVLEVTLLGRNVSEILELSAEEVREIYGEIRGVSEALEPLIDLGLGYLPLGQPAPTLSGGEAQRLKLARFLAEARKSEHTLFILDEPTAGLHHADIALLMQALEKLVDAGHSALVVDHNLRVVAGSDWVIDLGPEGGDEGGLLLFSATPQELMATDSPTGLALRETRSARPTAGGGVASREAPQGYAERQPVGELSAAESPAAEEDAIQIVGAREHNLRNVSVSIPTEKLVAVTGVSGSGKSSLAFDVLYSEGRRRFLDCLPAYVQQFTRQLSRPEVDEVLSVPPTVALEQKVSRAASRATVGTTSEVYHYLRLLYAAAGAPVCPNCGTPGEAADAREIADRVEQAFEGRRIAVLAPVLRMKKGLHKELLEEARNRGVSTLRVDGRFRDAADLTELERYQLHDVDFLVAETTVDPAGRETLRSGVERALNDGEGNLFVLPFEGQLPETAGDEEGRYYSARHDCPRCGETLPVPDPRLFSFTDRYGACPHCAGSGIEREAGDYELEPPVCSHCEGTRLRPEARAVRIDGRDIGEVGLMSIRQVGRFVEGIENVPGLVQSRILPELRHRLGQLEELGVGYLQLHRGTNTLSTGEAQRVRVAAELSTRLRGCAYVLDEPTVGLHPRDTEALVSSLLRLRDEGNTVVVVEHEEPVIRRADYLIDLGPGAGHHGGEIVARGTAEDIAANPASVTGRYLREQVGREHWHRRPLGDAEYLSIRGASLHNLRDVDVDIPRGRLVCVTGVSGSGKSSLVRDVSYGSIHALLARRDPPAVSREIEGWESFIRANEIDESPIGRTPRSVPATYVGAMDAIRDLFARSSEARARGYGPGRFSFNVEGGRCEDCKGQGQHRVEMPLLPVVYVACSTCGGRRYNPQTLEVEYRGKSIADVLEMTVNEALSFFENHREVARPLQFLQDIGLGYLHLGQPSPTLSGGEAQRLKLAAEIAGHRPGDSFYVLDEPTTGLHMSDVSKLIGVLQGLVDRGDTVVVIEHDLDVVAAADCVIDLGPEGGEGGGRIVAWGTPEDITRVEASQTGRYLAEYFAARS